ncbi:uncharacterized protein LOC133188227 [Saccostrea echinata]|uniref:uncharacterized protein LOC133188227 n=1 Tax=Saccostrea echinata TaxID=191078 RepID=UPI002A832597|nr:uncharacterized protein LOC133188227 [Saccostrea echinata]
MAFISFFRLQNPCFNKYALPVKLLTPPTGTAETALWDCLGYFLGLLGPLWDCSGTALGLLWDCCGTAVGLLYQSQSSPRKQFQGLLWGCFLSGPGRRELDLLQKRRKVTKKQETLLDGAQAERRSIVLMEIQMKSSGEPVVTVTLFVKSLNRTKTENAVRYLVIIFTRFAGTQQMISEILLLQRTIGQNNLLIKCSYDELNETFFLSRKLKK